MDDATYHRYIRRLMAHLTKRPEYWYIAHQHEELAYELHYKFLSESLKKLDMGVPLEYVIGWTEFYSNIFNVSEHVLIPRAETEILVEKALSIIAKSKRKNFKILELGVGSGAVIISILSFSPWPVLAVATDISRRALLEAKNNSVKLGVNVVYKLGNWWDALQPTDGPFDLIISNPPYVGMDDEKMLSGYEPAISLFGSEPTDSGLIDTGKIINNASDWLVDGGKLLIEHSSTRRKLVENFAMLNGLILLEQIDDYAGLPRVLLFEKPL
mgnify:FL=1|tara:strand:- start:114 stop:923 length:810 start_codon:yes stop_codon:yes gene_type:complete